MMHTENERLLNSQDPYIQYSEFGGEEEGDDDGDSLTWRQWIHRARRPIPLEERVILSPVQKFTKYGRVPLKILLHLILVVLVTVQSNSIYQEESRYTAACIDSWSHTFLPKGFERINGAYEKYLYTLDEVKESLNETVRKYFTFNKYSVDYIHFNDTERNAPKNDSFSTTIPIKFTVTSFKTLNVDESSTKKKTSREKVDQVYELFYDRPLGPLGNLDQDSIDDFFQGLVMMKAEFGFQTFDALSNPVRCWSWKITNVYDFEIRGGRILLRIKMTPTSCAEFGLAQVFENGTYPWLVLVILLTASLSLVLTIRGLIRSYNSFNRAPEHGKLKAIMLLTNADLLSREKRYSSTKEMKFRDRLRAFNMWHVLTMVMNVVNIIAAILDLAFLTYSFEETWVTKIIIGTSAFLTWLRVVQYFEWFPKYYVLVMTLRRALPTVFRFVLGTMPVYVGYALFGMTVFGSYSEKFSTFNNACRTLFAILNGDVILETYKEIDSESQLVSFAAHFYMYTFITLFIYCVLNIFIIIVEDAFYTVKKVRREQRMNQRKARAEELLKKKWKELQVEERQRKRQMKKQPPTHVKGEDSSSSSPSGTSSDSEEIHELSSEDDGTQMQNEMINVLSKGGSITHLSNSYSGSSRGGGSTTTSSTTLLGRPTRGSRLRTPRTGSSTFAARSMPSRSQEKEGREEGGAFGNWLEDDEEGLGYYEDEDEDLGDAALMEFEREMMDRRMRKFNRKLEKTIGGFETRIVELMNMLEEKQRQGDAGKDAVDAAQKD